MSEYSGTALQFLTGDRSAASADPDVTRERHVAAYAERGIAVLDAVGAQNHNALVVRRDMAGELGLENVSDLRCEASRLVLAGPPECPTWRLCLIGLGDVYGLEFARFLPLDVGGPVTWPHSMVARSTSLLLTADRGTSVTI